MPLILNGGFLSLIIILLTIGSTNIRPIYVIITFKLRIFGILISLGQSWAFCKAAGLRLLLQKKKNKGVVAKKKSKGSLRLIIFAIGSFVL